MQPADRKIKVAVAICEAHEVEDLIRYGADEFYCGVDSQDYPFSLNRREMPHGNVSSFEELKQIVTLSAAHGVPVYVTLNKSYYTQNEIEQVTASADRFLEAGASGFIVSDIGLMEYLACRDWGGVKPRFHLSSVAAPMNSEAVDFYRRRYEIERAILPRLRLNEIEQITAHSPDLEFEVLILGWYCPNLDGICSFQHDLKEHAPDHTVREFLDNGCCLLYDLEMLAERPTALDSRCLEIMQRRFSNVLVRMSAACECCYIQDLDRFNVTSLKIVSRLMRKEQKVNCVKFVRRAIAFLDLYTDRREYAFQVRKLYKIMFGFDCMQNCYIQAKVQTV